MYFGRREVNITAKKGEKTLRFFPGPQYALNGTGGLMVTTVSFIVFFI